MRRRQLLPLFGGVAIAWPLATRPTAIVHAQKRPRIAVITAPTAVKIICALEYTRSTCNGPSRQTSERPAPTPNIEQTILWHTGRMPANIAAIAVAAEKIARVPR